jgi:hypothetical protein
LHLRGVGADRVDVGPRAEVGVVEDGFLRGGGRADDVRLADGGVRVVRRFEAVEDLRPIAGKDAAQTIERFREEVDGDDPVDRADGADGGDLGGALAPAPIATRVLLSRRARRSVAAPETAPVRSAVR